jgi:ectoine hydroxylase-related dioxygenase (phytanoyl-CoA dioxygenase family)
MDDAQRASFARLGYLVIRDAIPADVLASCNALYDQRLAEYTADQLASGAAGRKMGAYLGKDRVPTRDRHGREYDGQRMWGDSYRWLIDNPAVEPLLAEMLSDPACVPQHCPQAIAPELRPLWRLDHDNIHYKMAHDGTTPDEGGTLHGVPEGFHVTAVYELCDVNVGDGGFGCLPGTHDFEYNARVQNMGKGWNQHWTESPYTHTMDTWPVDVPVHRVVDEVGGIKAGDCIIFSERTKHGTLPWLGEGERRTLFYKCLLRAVYIYLR